MKREYNSGNRSWVIYETHTGYQSKQLHDRDRKTVMSPCVKQFRTNPLYRESRIDTHFLKYIHWAIIQFLDASKSEYILIKLVLEVSDAHITFIWYFQLGLNRLRKVNPAALIKI